MITLNCLANLLQARPPSNATLDRIQRIIEMQEAMRQSCEQGMHSPMVMHGSEMGMGSGMGWSSLFLGVAIVGSGIMLGFLVIWVMWISSQDDPLGIIGNGIKRSLAFIKSLNIRPLTTRSNYDDTYLTKDEWAFKNFYDTHEIKGKKPWSICGFYIKRIK